MSTPSDGYTLPDAIKLKIYPLFLQVFPENQAALRTAIASEQWEEARQLVHKMIGTLSALGTQTEVGDRLQALRQAIKEESPSAAINALHDEFTLAAQEALAQVANFLKQANHA